MSKLIIVDGNNWFRRKAETSMMGRPVRECFDYIRMLQNPVIVAWDGYHAKAPRLALYPEYKAKRNKPNESFFESQKLFQDLLELTQAVQIRIDRFEADDIIAALVGKYRGHLDMFIESNDADFGQLNVPMSRPTALPEKPQFMTMYKTMVGDSSDNIPGAKGFGEKAWAALTDEQKIQLQAIILSGEKMTDEEIFEKVSPFYPKGKVLDWFMAKENRELLLTFHKIICFIPVPWELIEANTKVGVNQPELALPIFEEYML